MEQANSQPGVMQRAPRLTSRCKRQMLDESQMRIPTTGVYTKETVFIVTAGLSQQQAAH